MTEPSSSSPMSLKKVAFRDRAFTMGDITAVNASAANRTLLTQRMREGGYQVHKTPHFLIYTRANAPTTILAHWFPPETIDADLGLSFMQELKPYGLLEHPKAFGDIFGAVVCSLSPSDPQQALFRYATNTLQRYRQFVQAAHARASGNSPIDTFATLYRRVCQIPLAGRVLDAGCSFGFLPLILAEQQPSLTHILGVDLQTDSFAIVRTLAAEHALQNVHFASADLLSEQMLMFGAFDTTIALHVLEHFSEADMYRVLSHLLQITSHRLILAVPYEPETPEVAYGHQQLFTPEKLASVGVWCLQQWGGVGQVRQEVCAGGLLLIERTPPGS